MIHAFYFRGLSTSGRDQIQLANFKIGSFFTPIEAAMRERGIQLHSVLGMGAGSLEEVSARAWNFIEGHDIYTGSQECHLIGHSAGGLIARSVEARAATRFKSLVTIASAHQGSSLAERCLRIKAEYPRTDRLLKLLSYDLDAKHDFLVPLTPVEVARYFAESAAGSARKASVVCSCPNEDWCAPLRWLHRLPPLRHLDFEGDGIVEKTSQVFGEVLGEVPADHLAQIGLLRDKRGMNRICDLVEEFIKRN